VPVRRHVLSRQGESVLGGASSAQTGSVYLFNTSDRIEENEFADAVTTALESLFPEDPPRFMARTPHGYSDRQAIERDLANGGFTGPPQIATVAARSASEPALWTARSRRTSSR